jgi:two-component system, chemotaxis family, sensor kinase CheA
MSTQETKSLKDEAVEETPKSSSEFDGIYSQIIQERKYISSVLSIMGEGFFILDSDFNISKRYSSSLKDIFGEDELGGKNFIEILANRVPENVLAESSEYLTFMFRNDLDEETINELNPLTKIEFHYEDGTGLWSSTKHMSFIFKRHATNDGIDSLLCSVKDISDKIRLSEKLETVQKDIKTQIDWLVNILHVEPPLMQEFMIIVSSWLDYLDDVFRNQIGQGNYKPVISKVQRAVNRIRTSASLLELNFFRKNIADLEEILKQIKTKKSISGSDFVPIVVQLGEIRHTMNEMKTLIGQLKNYDATLRTTRRYESGVLLKTLKTAIENLSDEFGKKVNFYSEKFDALIIPYALQNVVREYLLILIRFTLLHSLEKPSERKAVNKSPVGTIEIETMEEAHAFGFKLKHDGRLQRIERLIHETTDADHDTLHGNKGDGSQQLGSDVLKFLFTPGNYTKSISEAEHSKAVFKDMELVKKKLKMRGGRIKVTFTAEQFCEYSVTLPKPE